MVNARPRLSAYQRELAGHRVRSEGWTVTAAAGAAGSSRQTVHKWIRRLELEGGDGLRDRSSRPQRLPRLTRIDLAVRICWDGKAERFIKTLQARWAYARLYRSSAERAAALPAFLDEYSQRRSPTLGGHAPLCRFLGVNNLSGNHN